MELSYKEIRAQICDVCHKMWQLGWVAANDGNVSVKIGEDLYLATPTGISKSFITPEKLIKINGKGEVLEALEEMGVHFNPMEAKSALRAGEMHRRHRQRSGSRRSLDEFMVGAHALLQCDGLITWNDTFYRDYFKGLKLIVPQA